MNPDLDSIDSTEIRAIKAELVDNATLLKHASNQAGVCADVDNATLLKGRSRSPVPLPKRPS